MRTPHLTAAIAAGLVVAVGLAGMTAYARAVERRHIHALAPLGTPKVPGSETEMLYPQKNQGSALQREAFRQPDLLPLYGSSEVAGHPFDATVILRSYPTGFTVFPVGWADTTTLIFLQKLAAIGDALRGEKVVISLSPSWFYAREMVPVSSYQGNFSRLHAGELLMSTDLSFGLKQAAARRMLEYDVTLQDLPLLRFAAKSLADGSALARVLYYGALPLGKLHVFTLRLQDHWETLKYIRAQRGALTGATRRRAALNWPALVADGDASARRRNSNNPFGLDNTRWLDDLHAHAAWTKDTWTDREFLRVLRSSQEWRDFELLLRGLTELGAEALVLSMPIHGAYADHLGISRRTRQAYYDRLRATVARYGMPLIDFAEYEDDRYFRRSWQEHLSPKGWVFYAHALDAFFHDRPLEMHAGSGAGQLGATGSRADAVLRSGAGRADRDVRPQ